MYNYPAIILNIRIFMVAAASTNNAMYGDLQLTVSDDTYRNLSFYSSKKYELRDANKVIIHLDKLSGSEISRRMVQSEYFEVDFAAAFNALPRVRHEHLANSLEDVDLHQELSASLSKRYSAVFSKYTLAYNAAHSLVEAEIAQPAPPIAPLNMKQFFAMRGQEVPKVTVICRPVQTAAASAGSLEEGAPAGPAEEAVPIDFLVAAANSPVIKKMNEAGMRESVEKRIELHWDASRSTVDKVIQFMYDREPIKIDTDQEAVELHNIAQAYEMDEIVPQCQPRAKREMLTHCHPDSLINPEAFEGQLKDRSAVELVAYYVDKRAKVDCFHKDYLRKILPPLPEAEGASAAR
jgi:hypothetical protein